MEQHHWSYYAWLGGCVALALFIRYRRIGRPRRLRLATLWIIPGIVLLLGGTVFWQYPPVGRDWLWVVLGFAAGGAVGWWRARLVQLEIDSETGLVNQRSSGAALIVLVAIMAVRGLLRYAVILGDEQWHFGAMLISDIFIAIALGALSLYRVELFVRARRLPRDH